ncbi:MAG: tripartite tricarboxylate transporter substrate binding protein [Candidatus Methanomethylicia archaeon]
MNRLAITKSTIAAVIVVLLIVAIAAGYWYYSTVTAPPKYPSKPIVIICPWAAGGGTDRISRMVASLLEKELGVPVSVENRVGGGGAVGHTAGATAPPDGYTLTIITWELSMLKWMGFANVTYIDFKPIAQINFDPAAINVRADAPWNNVHELLDYIRKHPGELTASGTALGGVWDIARIGWLKTAGLDPNSVRWVPSTGAAPALQEVVAGGIAITTCSLPEAKPLIDAGKVKCLAVMADERNPAMPNIPTLNELGMKWSYGAWRGFAVPKGTPDYIVKILEDALKKIYDSKEFKDFMNTNGFGMVWRGSSDFAKFLAEDYESVGKLVKEAYGK